MSTASLDAALSGLKAAQQSLNVISNNIANASTEGYTRKILPQETLMIGGVGVGVKLQAIVRNVDKALLRDLVKQVSIKENYAVKESYLDRVQDFHGASESERAISARLGALATAFSTLSSAPDSSIYLNNTLDAARNVASTFNDFSKLITQMRNQTEDEIVSALADVNQNLEAIATLNNQIMGLTSGGQSTAELEDQRDRALRTVSQYIQISTFTAENNKLVVMTKQGQTLVDGSAHPLSLDKSNILPTSYYPGGGVNGLFVDGGTTSAIEISGSNVGGSIGALLELRDEILPQYTAQADELAQKLAERFDAIGLRLFTDQNGDVPASVADPGLVGYVGFSAEIRVNEDIVNDTSLIRTGTAGATVLAGSNEIIRKVSEFVFGPYAYQQAQGSVDISAGTLFATLGLTQTNQLIGTVDLTDYAPDLDAAPNIVAPADFTLDIGGTPYNITINPGDTATDLVNTINAAVGSTVADLNGLGQLRLNTTADITISDVTIGAAGIADLGLSFGVTPAQNPSFSLQVGTQSPVTFTISPGDTATDLLNDINAVDGVTASLGGGGELVITPDYGGDLTLLNVTGTPLTALGITVTNIAHTAFRQNNLGPDGSVSTGLLANSTLEDYARTLISAQGEDHALAKDQSEKEEAFFQTLDSRNSDQSGVNIDEELSNLIRIQTAYTAAARMISATEKTFNDLIAAFS